MEVGAVLIEDNIVEVISEVISIVDVIDTTVFDGVVKKVDTLTYVIAVMSVDEDDEDDIIDVEIREKEETGDDSEVNREEEVEGEDESDVADDSEDDSEGDSTDIVEVTLNEVSKENIEDDGTLSIDDDTSILLDTGGTTVDVTVGAIIGISCTVVSEDALKLFLEKRNKNSNEINLEKYGHAF